MRGHAAMIVLALSGVVHADDGPSDRGHDFHTIDRLTATTTLGIALGIGFAPGSPQLGTAVGADLAAHYVHASGAGGYLVFPISFIAADGGNQKALGNAELGALYARDVTSTVAVIGHLGVAYDYEHQGIAPLQPAAAIPRYEDLVQRWPFTTWLRFGFSGIGRTGTVFWRADLGLDLMLDDHEGRGAHISPIVRAGVAAGLDLGRTEVSLELTGAIIDPDASADRAAGTIAIGCRINVRRVHPGVAVILPVAFNTAPLDQVDIALALSVTTRL